MAFVACSDPSPAPSCTVDCDAGAPEDGSGGSPVDGNAGDVTEDGSAPEGGSADGKAGDATEGDGSGGGVYDAKSYELVGRFDWATRRLMATERVTLTKTSGTDVVVLDAAVDVKGVKSDDGTGLPFTSSPNLLRIDVSALGRNAGGDTVSFTIVYEAATSDALVGSVSRDDDPVTSRVVYTDSEPFGGAKWLPAIHKPSDRAMWKVELTVLADEDVIANGTRTKDDIQNGERVIRYEMTDPIPTYTMAFAAGELEHRDRPLGRVPLSVWYRRGLAFEPDTMLDFLTTALTTFETRLGPYPFSRYAVVLLPEFSGGMENTTITFTSEPSGQANLGTNLQAHEFGHQWFGDWVTVATFDDVWIKEGMATLLAAESDRQARDAEGKGRLFGNDFSFAATDAIRDRSLVGLAKYTSGPYARAAWLLTQIRDRVGETAFWGSLRDVLARYALGSIDSESFLRSFGLDEPTVEKALRALDAKVVPTVAIGTSVEATGTLVKLNIADPGGTMIAPTVVTVVDAAGEATSSMLVPDVPLGLTVPTGGYVAPDETDVHPSWSSFTTNGDEFTRFVPLLLPASDAARAAFATRSASHQERALSETLGFIGKLDIAPADFPALYRDFDSTFARRWAEFAGCYAMRDPTNVPAWTGVLGPILAAPALTNWSTAYAACGTALATSNFGAEIATLGASVDSKRANRFVYLSSFDYGAAATFDALSQVAMQAPSLQLRDQAITRLGYQAAGFGYTPVTTDQRPRWKEFFRGRLTETRSANRFPMVWRGVVGLSDDLALVIAGGKLHTVPLSDTVQRTVVCDAYAIAQRTRPAAWTEFQEAARPWDTLGASARSVLMSGGAGCVVAPLPAPRNRTDPSADGHGFAGKM